MRFAGRANVSNYISAGRTAASSAVSLQNTARAFAPNYTDMAAEGIKQDALNFQQMVNSKKGIVETGMQIDAKMRLAEIDAENAKTKSELQSGLRKAGAVAAAGKFASAAFTKPIERPAFDDGGLRDYYAGKMSGLEQEIAELREKPLEVYEPKSRTAETSEPTSVSSGNTKPISSGQMLESGEDPSGGGTLNFSQLRDYAIQAGFKGEQADIMAAIAMGESGGRVAIDTVQSGLDKNKSNEYSIGATQINVQAHGDKLRKLGYTEDDLRDPVKNFQLAKMVHDEVGSFRPWSVYKSGDYLDHLPR